MANKSSRARSFQGRAAQGMVHLPHDAPWTEDLMAELMRFPGDPDDQVDVLGMLGRMVDEMQGGRLPKPKTSRRDRWDKAFDQADHDDNGGNWKLM